MNQLVAATATEGGSDGTFYEYDANGNLTKKSEGTLRYFGPFMHVIEDSSDQTEYYWDSRNLLTKIAKTVVGRQRITNLNMMHWAEEKV